MYATDIDLHGPLFNGTLDRQINAGIERAKDDVAQAGVDMMHQRASIFRQPTGYWESQLQVERAAGDRVVADRVVYNNWLEGVSSRNRTTRFKGYRIWRRTHQELDAAAGRIATKAISRAVG